MSKAWEQSPLWAQVAADASWRPCRKHGLAAWPELRERFIGRGRLHLEALCPTCQKHLGFVHRKPRYWAATPAEMERTYRRFVGEAKSSGAKPGQAYVRFKIRFGCEPDPAWDRGGGWT